jgi:hypothetical protein
MGVAAGRTTAASVATRCAATCTHWSAGDFPEAGWGVRGEPAAGEAATEAALTAAGAAGCGVADGESFSAVAGLAALGTAAT